MRLKATSLIETLVASIVFLIVFVIAMDSVVRLNSSYRPGSSWAEMERDYNESRTRYKRLLMESGAGYKSYAFRWGRIDFSCERYKDFDDLWLVTATVVPSHGNGFSYIFLHDGER